MEQYYPTVSLGPAADRCRIAFSRERDENDRRSRRRDDEEEWKCRVVRASTLHALALDDTVPRGIISKTSEY